MKFKRKSIRLKNYDYSESNAYFVTICTQDRKCFLSSIIKGESLLSDVGLMAREIWNLLPQRFSSVILDEIVVMPNHIHGIIFLQRVGTRPTPTIGQIVGAFKSITTNEYIERVKHADWPTFNKSFWQRNYFERIIRSETELFETRKYVQENPLNWNSDPENVFGVGAPLVGALFHKNENKRAGTRPAPTAKTFA